MAKLEELIVDAEKACSRRGHRLSNWVSDRKLTAYNECLNCGTHVTVRVKPMPNQVDISGDAVALNCRTES